MLSVTIYGIKEQNITSKEKAYLSRMRVWGERKKKNNSLIHSFTQKLMYEELSMCQAHFFQCKALALIILLDAHGNRGLRE